MAELAPVVSNLYRIDPVLCTSGTSTVARFNVLVHGLLLMDLRLMRGRDGKLHVPNWCPRGGAGQRPKGVVFKDEALRAAVLAAVTVAMGGVPDGGPLEPRRHRGARRPVENLENVAAGRAFGVDQ